MIINNKSFKKPKSIYRLPQMLTSFFIATLCSFYLLYVGPGGYQSITEAKFSAFCWIAGGYVAIIIILKIELLIIGQDKFSSYKGALIQSSWTNRLIILFLIFSTLSALLSPYGKETIIGMSRYEGILTISIYTLCFLLVSFYGKLEKWHIYLFGLTMSLFCILSILQLLGYNPFLLYPEGYNYYDANIAYSGAYLGTIGNVDLVAALLCITIPLFTVSILRMKGKLKFLLLIPTVLCIVVLVVSNVQAGLVGIVCGMALILPIALTVSKKMKRNLWVCLLMIVIFGFISIWIFNFGGAGTLFEAHELLHGRWNDEYGSGRLFIWRSVLDLVPERLFFGGGPDTLLARTTTYFERYNESMDLTIRATIDIAHNEYLNILVNQGILAMMCYIGALMSSAVRFIKNKNNNATIICGSAVLCYSIQAFFGISMCMSAIFFWLLWALLEQSNNENEVL